MKPIFRYGYQDFMLFITFFMLWFSIQFGQVIQDVIAYILVVSIGIMHGANDLQILSKKEKNKHRLKKHIFYYVLIIFACVVIYFIHPFSAILLFILLSSYHFGEEHLGDRLHMAPTFSTLYYMVYGLFLFSLLFYEHLASVDVIMMELTGTTFHEPQIEMSLIGSSVLLLGMSIYVYVKEKKHEIQFVRELFYLVLLFLIFKTATLIMSFAIYFIFWHSIPSIIHQTQFLAGDFTKASALYYTKKALLFWFISIAGLIGLYLMIPDLEVFGSVVFAILFAVTAPHTWVMSRMKANG